MTGDKKEISLRVGVVCIYCSIVGKSEQKMEIDSDMEGKRSMEFVCPNCGIKVEVQFMLGN